MPDGITTHILGCEDGTKRDGNMWRARYTQTFSLIGVGKLIWVRENELTFRLQQKTMLCQQSQ